MMSSYHDWTTPAERKQSAFALVLITGVSPKPRLGVRLGRLRSIVGRLLLGSTRWLALRIGGRVGLRLRRVPLRCGAALRPRALQVQRRQRCLRAADICFYICFHTG